MSTNLPDNKYRSNQSHQNLDTQLVSMPGSSCVANMTDRYVYHITDRDNLASIVRYGLISASTQKELEQKTFVKIKHLPSFFKPVPYENELVKKGENGKEFHIDDCVQFVFTAKDPRLFSIINSKNIDQDRIIFLCMKARKVANLGGCVSDRYAKVSEYAIGEEPQLYTNLEEAANVLDWTLIDSSDYGFKDEELKITLNNWARRAQAFIPEKVDFEEIDAIITFNDQVKNQIQNELKALGVGSDHIRLLTEAEATEELPTHPKFYWYKDHILGHEKESLVTGPRELYNLYLECIRAIREERNHKLQSNLEIDSAPDSNTASNPGRDQDHFRFEDVESLVQAIEEDFTILPELKGIYKLHTDTPAHHEDVGKHTLTTVRNLEDSKYYQNADRHLKNVIKLSAYLHDIGKGPREKWPEGIQHRYPDHPRDSISMLKRILTEEIKNLSDKDIHDICLMVIYHDIVGECQNKGRSYQEVANIVECQDDLEKLYCISEADIRAIKDSWYEKFMSLEKEFREDICKLKTESKEVWFP